uniref:ARID domain-containing protein n=1 Tax=Kalanchoe fedtschenkoi TaxID=63787 RepID=A0A7N0UTP4_KALFE
MDPLPYVGDLSETELDNNIYSQQTEAIAAYDLQLIDDEPTSVKNNVVNEKENRLLNNEQSNTQYDEMHFKSLTGEDPLIQNDGGYLQKNGLNAALDQLLNSRWEFGQDNEMHLHHLANDDFPIKNVTEAMNNDLLNDGQKQCLDCGQNNSLDGKMAGFVQDNARLNQLSNNDESIAMGDQVHLKDLDDVKLLVDEEARTVQNRTLNDEQDNFQNDQMMIVVGESNIEEERAAFMTELERFYNRGGLKLKIPKFYGQPLDYLKLWNAVNQLGGYDQVCRDRLWRQVGDTFNPPTSCTNAGWTLRKHYDKVLLEYEEHRTKTAKLNFAKENQLILATVNEPNHHETSCPGGERRGATAHATEVFNSELKITIESGDNEYNNLSPSREQMSRKREPKKPRRVSIIEQPDDESERTRVREDSGSETDWVKVNILQKKSSYEAYVLLPGLLPKEIQVLSGPSKLVIIGNPSDRNSPWGISRFKKECSLGTRIDPHRTSAVFGLHGKMRIILPFAQSEDASG